MQRNKLMSLAGLIIVASMILGACASPTAPPPQTIIQTVVVTQPGSVATQIVQQIVTATPVPATAAPTKPAAKPSDTAVIVLQQEPDTMHPAIGSMLAKTVALGPVFVGCVGQDEKANWIPLGCETVPTVDNGGAKFMGTGADAFLEVTYKIRKDWRWTDGTPVKSEDAVYYWKLWMDPDLQVADRSAIEKVFAFKAIDDNTFVVDFMSEKQAKAAAAGTLKGDVNFTAFKDDYAASGYDTQAGAVVDPIYWSFGSWYPAHAWSSTSAKDQAAGPMSKTPMGDGPYVVTAWKQGQEIDLTASDKPFPLGAPKVKNVVFRFIADTPAIIAALQNGEVDAVGQIGLTTNNAPDLDKIEAAGAYKAYYGQGYSWEHIDINTTKAPLDNLMVRQAMYYAIDKQTIVNKLYFGKQVTTDLAVPASISWAAPADYNKYPFDKAKAADLLKQAGYDCKALPCVDAKGKKLEITLMTTDRADRQALAQVIQSMWKAVNIGVNIQFLYGRGLFATGAQGGPLDTRTFDAAIYTWSTGDDPGLMPLYSCQSIPTKENGWSGQNYPGWCNQKANDDLKTAETDPVISLSRTQRKPLYADFFKQWTADVPVIPLFSNTNVTVARVGFKNWKPGPTSLDIESWNSWEWELSK